MKKAALVNPGRNKALAIHPPMNLGYIASYLEKYGVEVCIIDELAGQDVEEGLKAFRPEIAGITATTPLVPDAYRVARMAKELGILTVMGGVHASVLPEEALQYVDIVVQGEGERAMFDIIKNGIKSGIVSRPYIKDLDEIPPPAWHLMDMEFYLYTKDRLPGTHLRFVPPKTRTASILTIRGCPYACVFCHNSWRGLPVRFHSPQRVISEIRQLIEIYHIRALFFMDDNLFANKERLQKICELMRQNKFEIIWGCQARVDSINLETLKAVKEAGCQQVNFGFESGSQRILDILKNRIVTIEDNKRAIKLCKEADLKIFATFMIGNPTETIEDVITTQQFILDNKIDEVGILFTTPYPGTKLWQWCEEHNLIPRAIDWSKLTTGELSISACDTLPPETIKELYQEISYGIKPITILQLLSKSFSPLNIFKAIKHPRKAWSFIKKVKRGQ